MKRFSIFLVVLITLSACKKPMEQEFSVGSHHFKMPSSIIKKASMKESDSTKAILLLTIPSLEPFETEEMRQDVTHPSRLRIVLSELDGRSILDYGSIRKENVEKGHAIFDKKDEKYYKNKNLQNLSYISSVKMLENLVSNDGLMSVVCLPVESILPNPGCTVRTVLMGDIKFYARFNIAGLEAFDQSIPKITDFLKQYKMNELE